MLYSPLSPSSCCVCHILSTQPESSRHIFPFCHLPRSLNPVVRALPTQENLPPLSFFFLTVNSLKGAFSSYPPAPSFLPLQEIKVFAPIIAFFRPSLAIVGLTFLCRWLFKVVPLTFSVVDLPGCKSSSYSSLLFFVCCCSDSCFPACPNSLWFPPIMRFSPRQHKARSLNFTCLDSTTQRPPCLFPLTTVAPTAVTVPHSSFPINLLGRPTSG